MKISEAIKQLQEIQKTDGDLEIVDIFEEDDMFGVDHNVWFEVIGIPNEDETNDYPHVILNFTGRFMNTPPSLSLVDN